MRMYKKHDIYINKARDVVESLERLCAEGTLIFKKN